MRMFVSRIFFLLACLGLCGFNAPLRRAPEFPRSVSLNTSVTSSRVSIKALRGRAVLVVFWNPSDAGCEALMGLLNKWVERDRSRGLEIVGVYVSHWDYQKDGRFIDEAIKKYAIRFPVLPDPDSRLRIAYGQLMTPSIYCVDRKGLIRASYSAVFDMKDVDVTIQTLLEEAP
jgi:peroxiredoxin